MQEAAVKIHRSLMRAPLHVMDPSKDVKYDCQGNSLGPVSIPPLILGEGDVGGGFPIPQRGASMGIIDGIDGRVLIKI